MQQLRLFWAINLPVSIRARLAEVQGKLKKVPCDVKWVEEENLHLTMKFLGNVEVSQLSGLVEAVKDALGHTPSFALSLGGLGFFPDALRPRVLWAGLHGDLGRLRQIHEQLTKAHLSLGFPDEKRSFSPHLTLARLHSSREIKSLVSRVNELGQVIGQLGHLEVQSVDLMQSELNRRGPVYTLLAEVKLSG